MIRYVDVSAVDRQLLAITSHVKHEPYTAPSRARKLVREGDTVIATVRPTLRRIAQIPRHFDGEIVSTAFCVLRPNPARIDSGFLFFAVQTDEMMSGIAALETGASYPAVRDSDVLDQRILVPSLHEQSDIRRVLSIVRAAMLREREGAVSSEELKRAAMFALFTRGLRGEAQKEAEFGLVPESWELRQIGDSAHRMQYGLSIRGERSGAHPILRMNCQQDGKVVLRDLQYVDADARTAEAYRVAPGDLLFNRTNSLELVGRTAIVEVNTNAVFASYLVRISVDETRMDPRYLNHMLNWDHTQAELKKLASRGVGQANISASKLRDFCVPVPAMDEQREIVAILDAIDRKIDLHRRKRAVLDELFKALLHKLMTGEIRVSDLDLSALAPESNADAAA